jgi:hypothetical protein
MGQLLPKPIQILPSLSSHAEYTIELVAMFVIAPDLPNKKQLVRVVESK